MANEIRTAFRWQFWRASVMVRSTPQKETTTATTSEIYSDNTQIVGTVHEAIAAGDVTDDAMMIVENLHATAVVRIGGDAAGVFVPWVIIPPGAGPAVLPKAAALASTYLISSVAATPIRVTLIKIAA